MILEGMDGRVHFIRHTPVMENLRAAGHWIRLRDLQRLFQRWERQLTKTFEQHAVQPEHDKQFPRHEPIATGHLPGTEN